MVDSAPAGNAKSLHETLLLKMQAPAPSIPFNRLSLDSLSGFGEGFLQVAIFEQWLSEPFVRRGSEGGGGRAAK